MDVYRMVLDQKRDMSVSIRALQLAQASVNNSMVAWSAFRDKEQAHFLSIADDQIPMVTDEDVSEYMEFCTALSEGRTEYVRR